MEKFVQKGTEIIAPVPMAPPGTTGLGGFEVPSSKGVLRSDASKLNVGVLHLVPSLEVFPLLADPKMYAKLIPSSQISFNVLLVIHIQNMCTSNASRLICAFNFYLLSHVLLIICFLHIIKLCMHYFFTFCISCLFLWMYFVFVEFEVISLLFFTPLYYLFPLGCYWHTNIGCDSSH